VSDTFHSQRSVDVVIVDTPRAAGVALGTPRTDVESTHVLCRHADETPREFGARVRRRLERIRLTRCVRSLWYVVGTDVTSSTSALPLLGTLLPLLDKEATLTVVGPGSRQSVLFEGIESVLQRRPDDLTVRAELYADGDRALPRSAMRAGRSGHSSRHGGWFPVDTGSHAPDSVRAYVG
jgi:hypothetical protein